MLTELHIENFAVIERVDVTFTAGFNVLTGETGAGKSIVIDAINAVLGGRVSRELLRQGTNHALVTAVFTEVSAEDWLTENDINPEPELILQRRLGADGKSACRVCGVPVTVQQLRSLGSRLLDMHGQNDGRQLLDEARHEDYLDRFAGLDEVFQRYTEAYRAWRSIQKEIRRLSMDEQEKTRLSETLRVQVRELTDARIRIGEEAELTARRDLLSNAEKLTSALESAYDVLYGADVNAIGLAAEATGYAREAANIAMELGEAVGDIEQAGDLLEDAAERLRDFRNGLDFSEEEYDDLENRLALLRKLQRKYGVDEAGLAALLTESQKRLEELNSADDLLCQLERDGEKARQMVLDAGQTLTKRRQAAAKQLAKRVQTELKYLRMPSVTFVTEIKPKETAEGFDATGCDEVRFLMSANAGTAPGRITHVASGGELSRIMLALKSVFAEKDQVDTLVFDEIDTGVSGITAQRVGEKMAMLAKTRQLICITHLPQIAAMADTHFSIFKTETAGQTYTTVIQLDQAGRIQELARLHGGDAVTETTLKSAGEQLAAAAAFRGREREQKCIPIEGS